MLPLILVLGLHLAGQTLPDSSSGLLVVRLEGFSSEEGFARLAVFDSEEYWPEDIENAVVRLTSSIQGDTVIMHLTGLAAGEYAMAAFHDKDGDAVFDRGLFGVPTEDYGFSNNARGSTGPPDFEDALVMFEADTLIIEISIH
ncbi:MAG: DUF2141 domain-containing protein [Candidatus Fermentibacteraceae bacterium]|nr:DUF2141 domain-containing protein [Candidatus Fermentibacteraceae bacterium]MBN2607893.1 DUF2141 domain-containing protein [Candidatus Fermentibacteraceae bacterium]